MKDVHEDVRDGIIVRPNLDQSWAQALLDVTDCR